MLEGLQKVANDDEEKKLSNGQERLLTVMINPENVFKTVTEVCKLADISRTSYYKIMAKPKFVKRLEQEGYNIVKSALLPVVNTFKKEAINGSYKHGEAILKMGGMLEDKTRIEHSGKMINDVNVTGQIDMKQLTDEEVKLLEAIVIKSTSGTE